MKVDVIKAWKDPEYRRSLSKSEFEQLPENPVGVALDENDMNMIKGGEVAWTTSGAANTSGWFCSISAENTGKCCNPFVSNG